MFSDPIKNLKQLGLREDMIVADLGAGTGFYSIAASEIVTRGKVYAIEIIKDYVETIKNKAKEKHLHNIECFWGDVEKVGGTKIKDGLIDAIIISNILFQISDINMFVSEVKRISKVGGKILLIDWLNKPKHFNSLSPHKEKHMSKEKVLEIFKNKGFIHERDIEVGEHHYGMILVNKNI